VYVSVIHTINDPSQFWSTAESAEFPDGVSLHSSLPSSDGSKAACLWEADSVDAVRETVEQTVGDFSSNEYFEVDAERAQGLPS
jgi:hypothetical protein